MVVDLVQPGGEAQRDYVIEVGAGRVLEEIEVGILGGLPGETKEVAFEVGDGRTQTVQITLKDVKEKILPPLDDDLARAGSEFDTLADLRADLEHRIGEQIEEEAELSSAAAADALVDASNIQPSATLVEVRTRELLGGLVQSLERRGICG